MIHRHFNGCIVPHRMAQSSFTHSNVKLFLGGIEFFTIGNCTANASESVCLNSRLYPWALFFHF